MKSLFQKNFLDNPESEDCLAILSKPWHTRTKEEVDIIKKIFRDFSFFKMIPYKLVEIKDQEIENLIEKCLRYMKVVSFRPQEVVVERGRKIESLSLVLRGKIGLFLPKSNNELDKELESWRQAHRRELRLEQVSSTKDLHVQKRKHDANLLKKIAAHKFGSLAKENTNKFHLKDEIYKIKEVGEVTAGFHIFESVINSQMICEHTVIAKEQTDLVMIKGSDYHRAIQDLNNMYQSHFKLLQKSFLTADQLALHKISMYFTKEKVPSNKLIYREGEPVDHFYCILEGELLQDRNKRDTIARSASYLYGYTNLIDSIMHGDLFGDEWFFKETTRRYSAMTKSELMERLKSQHVDMTRRIKKLLELRRDILRKKIDPLDKKRARDFRINLKDIKKVMNFSPVSARVERNIETSKSVRKKKSLQLSLNDESAPNQQAHTETSRKNITEVAIKDSVTGAMNDGMNLPCDHSGEPPLDSKRIDRGVSRISSPSPTWSKPFFKCTMLPGSQLQKFVKNEGEKKPNSLKDETKNGPNYFRQADFIIKSSTNINGQQKITPKAIKSFRILNKPNTAQLRINKTKEQGRGYLLEDQDFGEKKDDEKPPTSATYRITNDVKNPVGQLESLSSKINDLSTTITQNINHYFTRNVNGNIDKILEQHAKSAQTLNSMSDRWTQSLMDLLSKHLDDEEAVQLNSYNPTPDALAKILE